MAANTATVSATPLGGNSPNRSVFTNLLVSLAAGDTLTATLVHRLTACPHEIRCVLRSVISNPSFPAIAGQVVSWNASQATIAFAFGGLAPAYQANYDVIAETTHSINQ